MTPFFINEPLSGGINALLVVLAALYDEQVSSSTCFTSFLSMLQKLGAIIAYSLPYTPSLEVIRRTATATQLMIPARENVA